MMRVFGWILCMVAGVLLVGVEASAATIEIDNKSSEFRRRSGLNRYRYTMEICFSGDWNKSFCARRWNSTGVQHIPNSSSKNVFNKAKVRIRQYRSGGTSGSRSFTDDITLKCVGSVDHHKVVFKNINNSRDQYTFESETCAWEKTGGNI